VNLMLALTVLTLAGGSLVAPLVPAPAARAGPLRLPNGEPLTCIYYFPHWWEPWKSDDNAIRADLQRLRAMGFNTLLLDHEWSQAIDGDWKWLDRSHRLAKEAGMAIVPWLSPKTWSDITPGHRQDLAKQWFGVDVRYGEQQDGSRAAPLIWDNAVHTAGAKYAGMYLKRYADGALLKLRWKGKVRRVISLSVESAWDGSFDDETNKRFRSWCRRKHRTIPTLNTAWGTRLRHWTDINPRDTSVFDYKGHIEGRAAHPQAVEDHVLFRSETIRDVLRAIGKELRRKWPDVLLMAEYPYQYEAEHPHARSYRIQYGANPESCDWADIVLLRATGPLSVNERAALERHRKRTGQSFVLTYRTYSDWDVPAESDLFRRSVQTYAGQASTLADGFGFYSWNEMVDTHVAFSRAMTEAEQHGWTAERAERAIGLIGAMIQEYRARVR